MNTLLWHLQHSVKPLLELFQSHHRFFPSLKRPFWWLWFLTLTFLFFQHWSVLVSWLHPIFLSFYDFNWTCWWAFVHSRDVQPVPMYYLLRSIPSISHSTRFYLNSIPNIPDKVETLYHKLALIQWKSLILMNIFRLFWWIEWNLMFERKLQFFHQQRSKNWKLFCMPVIMVKYRWGNEFCLEFIQANANKILLYIKWQKWKNQTEIIVWIRLDQTWRSCRW